MKKILILGLVLLTLAAQGGEHIKKNRKTAPAPLSIPQEPDSVSLVGTLVFNKKKELAIKLPSKRVFAITVEAGEGELKKALESLQNKQVILKGKKSEGVYQVKAVQEASEKPCRYRLHFKDKKSATDANLLLAKSTGVRSMGIFDKEGLAVCSDYPEGYTRDWIKGLGLVGLESISVSPIILEPTKPALNLSEFQKSSHMQVYVKDLKQITTIAKELRKIGFEYSKGTSAETDYFLFIVPIKVSEQALSDALKIEGITAIKPHKFGK